MEKEDRTNRQVHIYANCFAFVETQIVYFMLETKGHMLSVLMTWVLCTILYLTVLIHALTDLVHGFRKPDKTEDEEELGECPHCSNPLPLTHLDCPQCKNTLPYCIATVSLYM